MLVRPKHWAWLAAAAAVGFAYLEYRAMKDEQPWNTLTGRVRKWRKQGALKRAVLAAGLGGAYGLATDHLLHDDGKGFDHVSA